jgi:SAM-dependent methyltransferase
MSSLERATTNQKASTDLWSTFIKYFTSASRADAGASAETLTDLSEIFPPDYRGGTKFEVPHYAFTPDQWTRALLRGLAQFDGFKDKNVAELGVGTGINAAYVLDAKDPKQLFASDIDGRCTDLAARNVSRAVSADKSDRFHPVAGDQNLASWLADHEPGFVDVVYGCLPQVVKSQEMDIHEGDNVAHYYDPAQYPSKLHHLGLGLNDFALRQLNPRLNQGGTVILNLSGRPGREQTLELFRSNGFEPRILHEEVVAQHAGTSVATLAEIERRHGHIFEFFTSPQGTADSQISATEAETRRLAGEPVYHKIYVVAGTKL